MSLCVGSDTQAAAPTTTTSTAARRAEGPIRRRREYADKSNCCICFTSAVKDREPHALLAALLYTPIGQVFRAPGLFVPLCGQDFGRKSDGCCAGEIDRVSAIAETTELPLEEAGASQPGAHRQA
jgi:hypothetical protein